MPYRKSKNWDAVTPTPGWGIDWDHYISRGLVGCWLFTEGAGTKVNDLARVNNGAFTNDPTWTGGKTGRAALLDATNDYVDFGTATLLTSGSPFSLCWWEYITSDTNAYPSRFLLKIS